MRKEIKEVTIFLSLTLFLSYFVFWGPIAVFRVNPKGPVWAIILYIIGGFIPSILGIVLTGIFDGKKQVVELLKSAVNLKIGFKYYLIPFLSAVYITLTLIGLNMVTGYSFPFNQFIILLPQLIPLIFLGPLSEELGWRGFGTSRLLKVINPNWASLIIGLSWSFWHLPLFFMAGTLQSTLPFYVFLISTTSISFIFTYLYLKTKSVFSAVYLHWLYTFAITVIYTGITRTGLYNNLEFMPVLLIGIFFSILLYREKKV